MFFISCPPGYPSILTSESAYPCPSRYKRNGMFVDLGARNGEYNSTTVFMERIYGWSGICLEADPREVTYNLQPRRSCAAVDVVLGEGGVTDLCGPFDDERGVVGFDDDEYALYRWRAANNICTLHTFGLGAVLDAVGAPRTIDYLSLGTEDADEILRTFPFKKYRFRVISVKRGDIGFRVISAKHDLKHTEMHYQERIRVLLESNGYHRVQKTHTKFGTIHGEQFPHYITTVDFYKHNELASKEEIKKSFQETAWSVPARHEWVGALEATWLSNASQKRAAEESSIPE